MKDEREFYPVNKNFSCGVKEVNKGESEKK